DVTGLYQREPGRPGMPVRRELPERARLRRVGADGRHRGGLPRGLQRQGDLADPEPREAGLLVRVLRQEDVDRGQEPAIDHQVVSLRLQTAWGGFTGEPGAERADAGGPGHARPFQWGLDPAAAVAHWRR